MARHVLIGVTTEPTLCLGSVPLWAWPGSWWMCREIGADQEADPRLVCVSRGRMGVARELTRGLCV